MPPTLARQRPAVEGSSWTRGAGRRSAEARDPVPRGGRAGDAGARHGRLDESVGAVGGEESRDCRARTGRGRRRSGACWASRGGSRRSRHRRSSTRLPHVEQGRPAVRPSTSPRRPRAAASRHALVHGVEVESAVRGADRGRVVTPPRRDIRRQDAVGRLLQRRVPITRKPLEPRLGVVFSTVRRWSPAEHGAARRPSATTTAVRTTCPDRTNAWSWGEPCARIRSHAYRSASHRPPLHPVERAREVLGEAQQEVLGRPDAVARERERSCSSACRSRRRARCRPRGCAAAKSPRSCDVTLRSSISCRAVSRVTLTTRTSALPYWFAPRTMAGSVMASAPSVGRIGERAQPAGGGVPHPGRRRRRATVSTTSG